MAALELRHPAWSRTRDRASGGAQRRPQGSWTAGVDLAAGLGIKSYVPNFQRQSQDGAPVLDRSVPQGRDIGSEVEIVAPDLDTTILHLEYTATRQVDLLVPDDCSVKALGEHNISLGHQIQHIPLSRRPALEKR